MFGPSKKQTPDPSSRLTDLVRRVRRDQARLRERVVLDGNEGWYEQPAADFGSWNRLSDLLSRDRI